MPIDVQSLCEICKHGIYVDKEFIGCSLDVEESEEATEKELDQCDHFERDYTIHLE